MIHELERFPTRQKHHAKIYVPVLRATNRCTEKRVITASGSVSLNL